MAEVAKKYTLNGIEVFEIAIFNFTSTAGMDLKNVTVEFAIFEDLFSNFMTGEITVQDASSIIETLPVIGEEFVRIKFRTPTFKKYITKIFYVYKVESKASATERTDVFTLGVVSVESIISMSSSVNKSYSGFPISYTAQAVFDEYVLNSTKKFGLNGETQFNLSKKKMLTEETFDSHSFVGPGNSPFEFINYLASEAQSIKYKESDYVFYEDKDNFNFRTISGLMEQDPIENFYLADAGVKDSHNENKPKQYQTIQNFEFVDQFDVIERHASGMYDNTVAVIDPILKRYQETYYNYSDGFNELTHLGKSPVTTGYSHFSKLKGGDTHTRYLIGNISSGEYNKTSYLNGRTISDKVVLDPSTHYSFSKHKVLNRRISKLSQIINSIRCNISVPGNSDIKVGDVINVFIPSTRATEDGKLKYNYFYGQKEPKFLVTAVTHRYNYTQDQYFTIMEIVKDSYDRGIKDNSK